MYLHHLSLLLLAQSLCAEDIVGSNEIYGLKESIMLENITGTTGTGVVEHQQIDEPYGGLNNTFIPNKTFNDVILASNESNIKVNGIALSNASVLSANTTAHPNKITEPIIVPSLNETATVDKTTELNAPQIITFDNTSSKCANTSNKVNYRELVSFSQNGWSICSGSLVQEDWVLTAAHCCKNFQDVHNIRVKIRVSVMKKTIEEENVKIEDYFIHSNYTLYPLAYDACMVKIESGNKSTGLRSLSKLSSKDHFEYFTTKKSCPNSVLLGYSKITSDYYLCMPITRVLIAGDCKEIPGISETMFCGIDDVKKASFGCPAMSGGILICEDVQLGVISIPVNCGRGHIPTVFTRVDTIREFIDDVLQRRYVTQEGQLRSYELFSGQNNLSVTFEATLLATFLCHIFYAVLKC